MLRRAAERADRWAGPRGSTLRAARLALVASLAVLVAALLGPLAPWRLPAEVTLAAPRGQSRIHTVLVASAAAAALNVLVASALLATAPLWTRGPASDARGAPRAAVSRGNLGPAPRRRRAGRAPAAPARLREPLVGRGLERAAHPRRARRARRRRKLQSSSGPSAGATPSGTTGSRRTTSPTASPRARRSARWRASRARRRRRSTNSRSGLPRGSPPSRSVVLLGLFVARARLPGAPRRPRRSSSRSTPGTCASAPTGAATASSSSSRVAGALLLLRALRGRPLAPLARLRRGAGGAPLDDSDRGVRAPRARGRRCRSRSRSGPRAGAAAARPSSSSRTSSPRWLASS